MKIFIVWAIGILALTLMSGYRHKTPVAAAPPVPKKQGAGRGESA